MAEITITDDGDEVVFITIAGLPEPVTFNIDHGRYGWAGMEAIIEFVEQVAKQYNVPVNNTQDIV